MLYLQFMSFFDYSCETGTWTTFTAEGSVWSNIKWQDKNTTVEDLQREVDASEIQFKLLEKIPRENVFLVTWLKMARLVMTAPSRWLSVLTDSTISFCCQQCSRRNVKCCVSPNWVLEILLTMETPLKWSPERIRKRETWFRHWS